MGQQQLLLLVLSTVIVGLATVAGIQAFSQNQIQANGDQLASTALEMASDVQAWAEKPQQLGGGGVDISTDPSPPSLSELGYETGNTNGAGSSEYGTNAGVFSIEADASNCDTAPSQTNIVIVGENGTNNDYGNQVCVGIGGNSADDIDTQLNLGS